MPFIEFKSAQYFFQSHGPASASRPALVLLHGSGGDSSVWHEQITALADGQRVISADLPGHGQSGGEPAARAEHYARWLKLLSEALDLKKFVLAGHSMGGVIALHFAHMFPDALKGLILAGTALRFEIPAGYLELLRRNFDEACRVSCRQAYADSVAAGVIERGFAMLRRNGPRVLERDLMLCADVDSTPWACTLAMPCLILCGAQDAITPCALSRRLAGTIAGSTLRCISAAGHMVMQEQPELFNQEICRFIANHCPPSGIAHQ